MTDVKDQVATIIPLLIDCAEIAALAGVSLKTVRRWDGERRIPGRVELPGRLRRYRRATVVKWLEGNR